MKVKLKLIIGIYLISYFNAHSEEVDFKSVSEESSELSESLSIPMPNVQELEETSNKEENNSFPLKIDEKPAPNKKSIWDKLLTWLQGENKSINPSQEEQKASNNIIENNLINNKNDSIISDTDNIDFQDDVITHEELNEDQEEITQDYEQISTKEGNNVSQTEVKTDDVQKQKEDPDNISTGNISTENNSGETVHISTPSSISTPKDNINTNTQDISIPIENTNAIDKKEDKFPTNIDNDKHINILNKEIPTTKVNGVASTNQISNNTHDNKKDQENINSSQKISDVNTEKFIDNELIMMSINTEFNDLGDLSEEEIIDNMSGIDYISYLSDNNFKDEYLNKEDITLNKKIKNIYKYAKRNRVGSINASVVDKDWILYTLAKAAIENKVEVFIKYQMYKDIITSNVYENTQLIDIAINSNSYEVTKFLLEHFKFNKIIYTKYDIDPSMSKLLSIASVKHIKYF